MADRLRFVVMKQKGNGQAEFRASRIKDIAVPVGNRRRRYTLDDALFIVKGLDDKGRICPVHLP
jgi:hypothetical protein